QSPRFCSFHFSSEQFFFRTSSELAELPAAESALSEPNKEQPASRSAAANTITADLTMPPPWLPRHYTPPGKRNQWRRRCCGASPQLADRRHPQQSGIARP